MLLNCVPVFSKLLETIGGTPGQVYVGVLWAATCNESYGWTLSWWPPAPGNRFPSQFSFPKYMWRSIPIGSFMWQIFIELLLWAGYQCEILELRWWTKYMTCPHGIEVLVDVKALQKQKAVYISTYGHILSSSVSETSAFAGCTVYWHLLSDTLAAKDQ